ncbi:MAG: phage tail tape measure protein [Clostridium celatum]|nr:phage tail tape measure protein [Clostridium celatum]
MSLNAGEAIAYLTLDRSSYTSGIKGAYQELATFLNESENAGIRLQALGGAMSSVGNMLSKSVTIPLIGAGTAAITVSANFEEGMSKVQAISGATAIEMDQLSSKAKELGANTKFSASEASEAFSYMAMAGWKTADMLDGISGIMDLAAASGENLGIVSDIVTDALTAFGLQASDSAHFADVLAAASNNANTNVTMLGESFKYIAPVAGSLGYSIEDTAVALGLMANSGIKAGQAGTALRAALSSMLKPSDPVLTAMDQLNISLTNADGSSKSLSDVMLMLRDRFSALSEAQKAEYAATIFGTEAMSGMLAIINTSESDFNKLTTAINSADGTSKKMADTMQNNLKGKLTQLKSALEGAGIAIGEKLLPSLTDGVNKVTEMVSAFNSLDEGTQKNILKMGKFAAATGPVLSITGKLTTGLGSLVKGAGAVNSVIGTAGTTGAVTSLSAVMIPLVGTIAAVGTGLYIWNEATDVLNQNCTKSREEMSSMERTIADLTGVVTYSKKELIDMGIVYADFNKNISKEFQDSVKLMTTDIHEFGMSLGQINLDNVISEEEHKEFVSKVDGALKSALTAIDNRSNEIQSGLTDAFALDGVIDENESVLLEWWGNRGSKEKEEAQKLRDEISQIEAKAFVEGRILTSDEKKAIEERYAQIKQIELIAQASNSYELEYAHKEFQARMLSVDANEAEKLLQQRAQQRDEEQVQIAARYDTLISLTEQGLGDMSEEERKYAEDTISRLKSLRDSELEISNSYFEEDYNYAIQHNENLKDKINKYNGELLDEKDKTYYEALVKHREHYSGLEEITKDGLYKVKNEETGTWETIYAKVDDVTKKVVGIYNWNTQELAAMSKEDAKVLEYEQEKFNELLDSVRLSLNATSAVYADTEGRIKDSTGEVVGHIKEVEDENGNLVRSIETVNGTPIDLGDNTDTVIQGLKETGQYLKDLDGRQANVSVSDNGTIDYLQSRINGISGRTISVVVKGGMTQMSYATGTDNAIPGLATVAEYGPELIQSRNGTFTLATNRSIYPMDGGETVYNSRQTKEILRNMMGKQTVENDATKILKEVNNNLILLRASIESKEFNKIIKNVIEKIDINEVANIEQIEYELTNLIERRNYGGDY